MSRIHRKCFSWLGIVLLSVGAARAQDALKTIENPGGGQVVYGPLSGQSTLPGAMGYMLRQVHTRYGDRPQVGRVFQAKGSDSIAALFTLTAKTQGNKAIAGLVIVSMAKGTAPSAAVLTDDAARFGKTEPALLKKLNDAWQAGAGSGAAAGTGSAAKGSGGVPVLHVATGGDRSASVGLPAGWQITSVAGGSLTASGPNGELLIIGGLYQQIYDPRNPQTQRALSSPAMAGRPHLLCPYGGDVFQSYVTVVNQIRQNNRLPAADIRLTGSQPMTPTPFEAQAILATMELDLHDGKGMRTGSARIGISKPRGLAFWSMSVSGSSYPKTVAAEAAPAIKAMVASYTQNGAVIQAETKAQIDNIHAIGAVSAAQAKAADDRRVASSTSFNAHMDSIDRNSKAFQNYTLDQTQIQDNQNNTRGTVSNGTANVLIGADPNRFQTVPTQDFLKGVDY